jgi:lambda family phage tail tape measure protein
MATAVGALKVMIGVGTAEFSTEMGRVAEIAAQKGQMIKASLLSATDAGIGGFKSLANGVGMLMQPVSALATAMSGIGGAMGIGAGVTAVGAMFTASTNMAAGMADLSVKTGVGVEQLSRFSTIAKLSGTSMDTVAETMKKLSISAVEAYSGNEKLERVWNSIGVSTKELKDLGPDELMVRLAQAVQGLDPKIVQDLMKNLAGKGGSEALVFLKELNERIGETKVKISAEFAQGAKEFEDNLTILNSRAAALANTLTASLIPALNAVMEEMVKGGAGSSALLGTWSINWKGDLDKQLADARTALSKATGDRDSADDAGVWEDTVNRAQARVNAIESRLKLIDSTKPQPIDGSANSAVQNALKANNTSTSAGDGFLQGLREQIKNASEGTRAMLELKASEKGVLSQAKPLIEQLITDQGLRSAKLYEKSLSKQTEDIAFQNTLIGKTTQEQEVLNLQHKNQIDLQKQIQDLVKQYGELAPATQEKMTSAMESATTRQIQLIQERQSAERTFGYGAEKTFKQFSDDASNYGKLAENMLTNSVNGMGDALANFATTGKLNFTSLANSVISDIIRMQAKAAIAGLGSSLGGVFAGNVGGTGYTSDSPSGAGTYNYAGSEMTISTVQANGGAWLNGVQAFANGGVVSSPTLFPMAGGSTGLMGEAGAEGILPLSRASNGKLGVQVVGQQATGAAVNITVNNQAGGDGYEAVATAKKNDKGMDIEIMVRKAVSQDIRNNGPMAQQMASAFGLRRST